MKARLMRITIPAVALAVLAGPMARAEEYTETLRYDLALSGINQVGGSVGGVSFTAPGDGFEFLKLKVQDDTSPVVPYVNICQDVDGDSTCGEAGEASRTYTCVTEISMKGGVQPKWNANAETVIFLRAVSPATCSGSPVFATSGTVSLTVSEL